MECQRRAHVVRLSRTGSLLACLLLLLTGCSALSSNYESNDSRNVLPFPEDRPVTQLEKIEAQSRGAWPTLPRSPENAPNILLVLTDDAGYGAASTFGGPAPTPNLDRLARDGLRYTRFHTTGVCSPTRAALLTGRNHHAVGMGSLVEMVSPYPGYAGRIPGSAATVARILRDHGYNTAMFGKDHNVPPFERSAAGPFDHWPTGRLRGFEYFYGFVAGDTDQWNPALFENTVPVDDAGRGPDYQLDRDLADQMIRWIHNQKAAGPDKPFFAYLATGTPHAPHQALPEWIERFRGRFDRGWDVERAEIVARQKALGVIPEDAQPTPRPDIIPAWDSLSEDERRVFARYMEVFAAQLAYQDHQVGRVLDELERMGELDNTLILFIEGDNGASGEAAHDGMLNEMVHLSTGSELDPGIEWLADHLDVLGSPDTYQGYPIGWTWAVSAPFPWWKQLASHLGGVRNGLVVSWPARITNPGGIRPQYHHVIDVMPTILDVAGIPTPEFVDGVAQQPVDGMSMVYSFDAADVASPRTTQYYEVNGNHAIYHEGWLASTTPQNMPWDVAFAREGSDTSAYPWELYDLRADYSQSLNLASAKPEKLAEMKAIFDREARRFDVYPVQDTGAQTRAMRYIAANQPVRTRFTFWGADIELSSMSAPMIFALPFSIEAGVRVPEGGGQGVIVAAGSYFGGWSFYLAEGRLCAAASVSPLPGGLSRIAAANPLSPGDHTLRLDFTPTGPGGTASLSVDGAIVAQGRIEKRPRVLAGGGETFDTGHDANDPVTREYAGRDVFNGEIRRIDVELHLPTGARAMPVGH